MWRVAARCKRFIAAENAHQWQQPTNYSLCNSTASFSSSSSRNYCKRKRRKWPIHPRRTAPWHQDFAFQLAKHSFKQLIRKSKTHLLSDLINSFAAYEVEPTPKAYHFLVKILILKRPSNWQDQVRQILDHIEKVETPEYVFIDLIKFYGDETMFNDAVELFFRMPSPSVKALNALLSVLCRDKRGLEMIPGVLLKSNIRVEESSFGILIRALCRIGGVSNAFELLRYMVEEDLDVDQRVCSLILATMCREKNFKNEIMGFLEDLKSLGFEPRKDDFCNVIRVLVENGKDEDALGLLKQMKTNGIKPDIMCYNLVLDGLIQNGEFQSADKVFDQLLVLGLSPDIYTYNVYIKGLCLQNKVDDAIKMMDAMQELGCAPDSSTYKTVLRALCEAKETDRVREVANEMRLKSIKLNPQAYEILIDDFIANGDINGACSLLEEMLDQDLVPFWIE